MVQLAPGLQICTLPEAAPAFFTNTRAATVRIIAKYAYIADRAVTIF